MTVCCPFELESSWEYALENELKEPYLASLAAFIEKERQQGIPVYPPKEQIFNAFFKTPFDKVQVLIMGQDPYHGPGQAHGLAFSVPMGVPPPPSLKNIYKELSSDLGFIDPAHGCLIPWTEQGVLLLNATLTVREAQAMSHHGKGWERFTDAVVRKLAERVDPVIFVLWGKNAQDKCRFLDQMSKNHYILKSPHPSPLSAYQGFFGCKHFSQINELLIRQKKQPINWQL
jgi:uracil-DNA glycosylase